MSAQTSILSLPNELLVAIAAAGQEDRAAAAHDDFDFKTERTLSHICRRFRDVIVTAPELWTLVEVNLKAETSVEIFKLHLERSGTFNISANLQYLVTEDSDDLKQVRAAMEQLRWIALHIDRVWRLRIELRTEYHGRLLSPLRDVAVPNLRHFEIVNDDYEPFLRGYWVEIFSSGAPKLTFVKMVGFIPPSSSFASCSTSVTHLDLRGGEYYSLVVAEQCPLLVHLRVDIEYWDTPEHRYYIPSLKFLHMTVSDSEEKLHLAEFINLLDTPALTELIFDGTHGPQIIYLFSTSLLQPFPALTSLYFVTKARCSCESNVIYFVPRDFSPPLERFPALSSLFLVNQCFTSEIVKAISGPTSQPRPLLEAVTICSLKEISNFEPTDVSSALEVAARFNRQRGQALPKFRLSHDVLAQMDDWEEDRVDAETFDPTEIINSLR